MDWVLIVSAAGVLLAALSLWYLRSDKRRGNRVESEETRRKEQDDLIRGLGSLAELRQGLLDDLRIEIVQQRERFEIRIGEIQEESVAEVERQRVFYEKRVQEIEAECVIRVERAVSEALEGRELEMRELRERLVEVERKQDEQTDS